MNEHADDVIAEQLGSHESVLWAGRPKRGVVLRSADIFLIPFSLLWAGFAVFWEVSVITTDDAPLFFPVFGAFFVLMGIHFVVGRFLFDARQRASTYYGLTNQRALIVSGVFNRSVKSISLRTLTDMSFTKGGSGRGTITLGASNPWSTWYSGMAFPGIGQYFTPSFELIEDVSDVYEKLQDAQKKAN